MLFFCKLCLFVYFAGYEIVRQLIVLGEIRASFRSSVEPQKKIGAHLPLLSYNTSQRILVFPQPGGGEGMEGRRDAPPARQNGGFGKISSRPISREGNTHRRSSLGLNICLLYDRPCSPHISSSAGRYASNAQSRGAYKANPIQTSVCYSNRSWAAWIATQATLRGCSNLLFSGPPPRLWGAPGPQIP